MKPHMTLLLAVGGLSAVAGPGLATAAKSGDRDRDKMPDRWERKHGLNAKKNDARRDRDRDGRTNLREFRQGTNPRDVDSDDDGIRDGDELAGRVVSFVDGVLTIRAGDGDTLRGRVTAETEIACPSERPASLRHENDDDDDREEDGHDEDDDRPQVAPTDPSGTSGPAGPLQEDDDDLQPEADGHEEDDDPGCGPADLVADAPVQAAELELTASGSVFDEVKLGR